MLEPRGVLMRTLTAGLAYFALVLAAGFVFGCFRVLLIVPRVGERIEAPMMLAAIVLAARWVVPRFALRERPARPLAAR
jgi:hypothetical protein